MGNNAQRTYRISDIHEIMGISMHKTRDWIKQVYYNGEPFRVLRVGTLWLLPKMEFDDWLDHGTVWTRKVSGVSRQEKETLA